MSITWIWDLDGTLVDSYPIMLQSLEKTYSYFGWEYQHEMVENKIKTESIQQLFKELSKRYQLDYHDILNHFKEELSKCENSIQLFPHAKEVLEWGKMQGILQLMYTHKGNSTYFLLQNLGIEKYFTEIITAADNKKRKPHPEVLHYFVERYNLNRQTTYYIGDRQLDEQAAKNAGIKSINLTQPSSDNNIFIRDLSEMIELFNCK